MKYRLWDTQTKKMIYNNRTEDGTYLFLRGDGSVVGYGDDDDGYGGREAYKCYHAGRFHVLRCVGTVGIRPIYEDDIVRVCYDDSITGEPHYAVGVVIDVGELAPMVDFGLKAVPLDRFVEDEYLDLEVLGNTCENPDLEFEE